MCSTESQTQRVKVILKLCGIFLQIRIKWCGLILNELDLQIKVVPTALRPGALVVTVAINILVDLINWLRNSRFNQEV